MGTKNTKKRAPSWRMRCIRAIRRAYPLRGRGKVDARTRGLVEEYITEAEHGDGYGYWKDHFKTEKQVLSDVRGYLRVIKGVDDGQ